MANSKADKALLLRFNITQTLQIKLTKLKVYTYSKQGATLCKCHLCKYSTYRKSDFKIHLRTHTGEKPFSCSFCKYKSSQKIHLNRHIMTHTGEKHYNCAFCSKSFIRNERKTAHESVCKLNPRQSDPSWTETQKAFKCKVCLHSTAHKSNLKNHMMIHTGEKRFLCNLCNKRFILGADLRSHIFTHTREKPNNCTFCMTGFARITAQKKHEKICKLNPKQGDAKWVEEQKKFKCHLCKYRTITKGSLDEHVRSHTGEKPFGCPLCFYKFNRNSNLYVHLRRKHFKEKYYKCPKCDFTTLSTSKLLNHVTECPVKL